MRMKMKLKNNSNINFYQNPIFPPPGARGIGSQGAKMKLN